jgi:hypothetical protein
VAKLVFYFTARKLPITSTAREPRHLATAKTIARGSCAQQPVCTNLAALYGMKDLWCSVCNQAVNVGTTRVSAALAMSASGLIAAGIPKLLRRRSGPLILLLQTAMGAAAGYVANRYLVPKLQQAVCGRCGARAVAQPAAA